MLRAWFVAVCVFSSVTLIHAQDSEFREVLPNGKPVPPVSGTTDWETNFVGAARQIAGNLSNRLVFTSGGHGWTWSASKGWYTQRGVGQEMNEDYGNLDQMNSFVPYVFNAGATVVTFRPVGYQTNEVVLNNDSRGVTFTGQWYDSASEIYFGKSNSVPYRFSVLSREETATATYTPGIPVAGFYPVYTWARHGADRTSQLYRIQHTGGQTLVRVPHHMVGNGWVYLGTYYFGAGSSKSRGSVVISNLQPSPGFGSVAIADAIRFGNGMGDFLPEGGTVSGYPREEEAARYWVEASFGQGQTNFLATGSNDHQGGNVGAPIRMAREMNREQEGTLYKRIYLGFHSNAGGGRGVVGLWNDPKLFPGTKTPHQERWAELLGLEVNDTLSAMPSPPLEVPWFHRTRLIYARNDYAFGELNDRYIGGEFDATILEVAFHDSADDAKLLRDPKVRDILGRCSYQALVRYMSEFDGVPQEYIPQPPQNPRAWADSGAVIVSWDRPSDVRTNTPDAYLVYRSEDGYGFGNPVKVPSTQASVRLENLSRNKAYYFRVTAVNRAGESLVSPVVGVRAESRRADRVLFVNGYDQLERFNNPRQTITATNYVPAGAFGAMDRVIPRQNNAFDYVVQYGEALRKNGVAFDSCQRSDVESGIVELHRYSAVIWASGRQQTNLFTPSEQRILSDYIDAGGNLFLSGAFLSKADKLPGWQNGLNSLSPLELKRGNLASPVATSIFHGNRELRLGGGSSYPLPFVSAFATNSEARGVLAYAEDGGFAGVEAELHSGGRFVCLGFPFEAISSQRTRAQYLADILRFFRTRQPTRVITPRFVRADEGDQLIWFARPGELYQVQVAEDATGVLWKNVGDPVLSSGLTAKSRLPQRATGAYRVAVIR